MRRTLVAGVVALAFIGGMAHASTQDGPTPRYPATLKCRNLAEDSAAHVKLVKYEPRQDGSVTIVYKCRTRGY